MEQPKTPKVTLTPDQETKGLWVEFLGTAIFMLLGVSGTIALGLQKSASDSGSDFYLALVWGLSLAISYFIVGGVSGAHLNPAVTVALHIVGKFKPQRVMPYVLAQFAGGIVGDMLAFFIYRDAISDRFGADYRKRQVVSGLFFPRPLDNIGWFTLSVDSVIGTMFFLLILTAISDRHNNHIPRGLFGFFIGLADLMIVYIAFGYNRTGGGMINPVRAVSPRVVCMAAGFEHVNWIQMWFGFFGPFIGAIIGATLYTSTTEWHWSKKGLLLRQRLALEDKQRRRESIESKESKDRYNLDKVPLDDKKQSSPEKGTEIEGQKVASDNEKESEGREKGTPKKTKASSSD